MPKEWPQIGLGFGAAPFVKGSDTSEAAAESIEPVAETLAWYVLEYVRVRAGYGATRDEVSRELDIPISTVNPRMRELVLKGFVKDSGRRRKTVSGRQAAVMVACHD
jgi:hypothetical protein